MERSRFQDLLVYREATALADELWEAASGWSSFDRWSLGIQLVRASDSIGANIAEAFGRISTADQRRLLFIARGSAQETEHWIRTAVARSLLPATFEIKITIALKNLNGLIRSHRRKS
jgi:four helix bundle protein